MEGRTYRYMTEEPMYPFGYGLSYSPFSYSEVSLSSSTIKKGQGTKISCTVKNEGEYSSRETVQLYITDEQSSVRAPLFSLKGIELITLEPGASKKVVFEITPEMLELIDEKGDPMLEKGDFTITISGSLPTKRALELGASKPVITTLILK